MSSVASRQPETKAQDALLRFTDREAEEGYRLFVQPRVPITIAVVYLALFLSAVFSEVGTWKSIGSGFYYGITIPIIILLTLAAAILQVVAHILDRHRVVPRLTLLTISDAVLFSVAVGTSVTEMSIMIRFLQTDCAVQSRFYDNSGAAYRHANCHRQFVSHAIILGFVMAIRRIRLILLVVYTHVMVAHYVILILANAAMEFMDPALLYLTGVYVLGFLAFACAVRYQLEAAERRHFLVNQALEEQLDQLRNRSKSLQKYVEQLLPRQIVERSSEKELHQKQDHAADGVVCVITTYDFEAHTATKRVFEAMVMLEQVSSLLSDAADSYGLLPIQVIPGEFVFTNNLFDRRGLSSEVAVVAACTVAASVKTLGMGNVPLRACVHTGPLTGQFIGGMWTQYDVSGEALDVAREGVQYATSHQVLLTAETHAAVRSYVSVSPGPQLYQDGRQLHSLALSQLDAIEPFEEIFHLFQPPGEEVGAPSRYRCEPSPKPPLWGLQGSPALNDPSPLPRFLQLQKSAKQTLEENLEDAFATRSKWCLFREFVDEALESAFLQQRMIVMTRRAVNVWFAYAMLQFIVIVLLLADFPELPANVIGLVLLIVTVGISLAMAAFPAVGSVTTMTKWHTPWSVTGVLVPLMSILAAALSRPGAIGTNPRTFAVAAALVRAPCFYHARHQFIVIPLMLIVSQFQVMLPGGILDNLHPLTWFVVLFVVVMDSENDASQRANFVTERRLAVAVELLEEESRVRDGLIRCTLPLPLVEAWRSNQLEEDPIANIVPDTFLAMVRRLVPRSADKGAAGATHVRTIVDISASLEAAATASGKLAIAKVFGDTALLASPIAVTSVKDYRWDEGSVCKVLLALLQLGSTEHVSILADFDTSVQFIGNASLPSFSLSGVVVSRLLAMRNIGFGGTGLHVTDRVLKASSKASFLASNSLVEQQHPPLRIRGVGMIRMVKLSGDSTPLVT